MGNIQAMIKRNQQRSKEIQKRENYLRRTANNEDKKIGMGKIRQEVISANKEKDLLLLAKTRFTRFMQKKQNREMRKLTNREPLETIQEENEDEINEKEQDEIEREEILSGLYEYYDGNNNQEDRGDQNNTNMENQTSMEIEENTEVTIDGMENEGARRKLPAPKPTYC